MSKSNQAGSGELLFYSSSQSHLGKAQKQLPFAALLGVIVLLLAQSGRGGFPFFSMLFLAIQLAAVWLYLRHLMRPGHPLVRLSEEGIESPSFVGDVKSLEWREIASVSLKMERKIDLLEFKLVDREDRPDKRSFWTGRNSARLTISLAALDKPTQEKLLTAIEAKLSGQIQAEAMAIGELVKEMAFERAFESGLESLAPIPWMTYTLISLNLAVWFVTLSQGARVDGVGADRLFAWGGNAASAVQEGEWWRLLSATFLHNGIMHLLMNMIGLAAAGITVERIYGRRLLLLIYLGAGMLGSALSLHFSAQTAVSVGASGAVFGVTGALLIAVFQHRQKLPKHFSKQTIGGLSFFIVYALIQGFAKPGIDNGAHVGGLLGGCLLAFILPERFDQEGFKKKFARRAVAALVVAVVAVYGVVVSAPRATLDQARLFSSNELLAQTVKRFFEEMKVLEQEQIDLKAGKLSEQEVDERSRAVHAPVFRKVLDDLSKVELPPGDRRQQITKDIRRMAELLHETLAMDSVRNEKTGRLESVNPERSAKIDAEILKLAERVVAEMKQGASGPAAGTGAGTEAKAEMPDAGWSFEPDAFRGGMSVEEVSALARTKGHVLKCYGDLQAKERVRKDDQQACHLDIGKVWGVPAVTLAFTFGAHGLQTQIARFPERSWPRVRIQLDRMGQALTQTFGVDGETRKPVYGWRMDSGLVLSAEAPRGGEVTVLWTAKNVLAMEHCTNFGGQIDESMSLPVNELWPEIVCELPKPRSAQDCSVRFGHWCGR